MPAAPRICVCLPVRSLAAWLAHPDLDVLGARARHWVELRADRLADWGPEALAQVLDRVPPGRLVLTCRDPAEGGEGGPATSTRWRLWAAGLAAGVAWVDVELATALASPGRWRALERHAGPRGRRMLSAHLSAPPDLAGLMALWEQARDLGADACKVAAPVADAWEALPFVRWCRRLGPRARPAPVPVPLGPGGSFVRLLTGQLSPRAPVLYAAASSPDPRPLDLGQLPWPLLASVFRADRVGPETPVWGLVGGRTWGAHSPAVHSAMLAAAGRPGIYVPLSVVRRPRALVAALAEHLNLVGLSVTAPHKPTLVAACQRLTAGASQMGAINTLVRDRRGAWAGSNVDGEALVLVLKEQLGRLRDRRVVVIGTGGLGRAAAHALGAAGAQVTLVGRSLARSRLVARELGVRAAPAAALGQHLGPEVVVQATPQGEAGGPAPEACPVPVADLPAGCWVVEGVYRPLATPLVRAARARGLPTITGDALFARQACLQARRFYGLRCDPTAWARRLAAPTWAGLLASASPQPPAPPAA